MKDMIKVLWVPIIFSGHFQSLNLLRLLHFNYACTSYFTLVINLPRRNSTSYNKRHGTVWYPVWYHFVGIVGFLIFINFWTSHQHSGLDFKLYFEGSIKLSGEPCELRDWWVPKMSHRSLALLRYFLKSVNRFLKFGELVLPAVIDSRFVFFFFT